MKNSIHFTSLFIFLTIISSQLTAQKDEQGKDRTQSPYFEVVGTRAETETLPLLSTNADVNIAGVIADVKIRQVYVNRGKTPIEASYIFPLSTKAAVYGMQFTLGKRIVKAEIQEKEKALQTYTNAKNEGKTAGLVQQHRPNVFQMNLANIMPGDTINVDLFYTELVMCENGVYEFAYPTVVGPRYTADIDVATNTPNEKWVGNPYTKEGKLPTYLFDIKAQINAGIPLHEVKCTSHDVNINFNSESSVKVDLKASDVTRGNKDFILKYRLTGDKIQEGILCYDGGRENYFLMMMQPPKTVSSKELPPREYIFIMDISGSQSGFPIEVSKELMKNLLVNLRPQDRFNVLLFAGSSAWLSETSLPASNENIQKGIELISNQRGGGSTNLLGALQKAMTFKKTEGYSRTFAISTDGYITVEKETFQYVKDNLGDANFFTFGIGSSVNRYLIEGLAHAGMGETFVVTKQAEAEPAAEKFKTYIENPVLTNIKIAYSGFDVYDMVPLNVPDIFAQRPIIIFGKYKGSPSGKINVTGINTGGKYSSSVNVMTAKADKANAALKYLWARHKIREYDFAGKIGNDMKKEITQLGLEYGLLTEYTSFVAVDNVVRNKSGKIDSVAQPLPLPEGVTENALGTYGVAGNTHSFGYISNGNAAPVNATGGTGAYTYTWSNTQQSTRADKKSGKMVLHKEKEVTEFKNTELSKGVPVEKAVADTMQADTKNNVLSYAEVMPQYPGGEAAMKKFLDEKIVYPKEAKEMALQGTVYVKFIVGKDGTIRNIKILKGVHALLNQEAIRVIKLMPKWNPGKMNGQPVEVEYTVPVKFKLN